MKTARRAALYATLTTLLAIAIFAIPACMLYPFRAQGERELPFALALRDWSPWLTALCLIAVVILALRAWRLAGTGVRLVLGGACFLTLATSVATHVNIFEKMFNPYAAPAFVAAGSAPIEDQAHLLTVTIAGQTHAYPIRTIGYHHIINDTLGGAPIAATYCTLCHTGIVWSRVLDGRTLTFFLAGINNGNALLRDRETGTVWQQSTGVGIFGPLKGRQLTLIPSDELTFALWRTEQPNGLILAPDAATVAHYEPADWEANVAKTRVVVDTSATGIPPHTIMLGVTRAGYNKAYPLPTILADGLVEDRLNGEQLLFVTGPDHASVRAFAAKLGDQELTFSLTSPGAMVDRQTSSTWNFQGCATAGPLSGKCLPTVETHKDFWFDWHNHNPGTLVFHG